MSDGADLPRVALVEDDADLRAATVQTLQLAGFAVDAFPAAEPALAAIDAAYPGVVVTDVRMPGIDGISLFHRLRERDAELPVLLITGHGDVTMAVETLKAGAWDFVTKPFDPDALVAAVRRAAETRALAIDNRRLRALAEQASAEVLVGEAPAIARIRQTVPVLAGTDLDVLIEGETGTGKELVARLLHRAGRRARHGFVTIACAAIPEALVESALFGEGGRMGPVAEAQRGTLFLDDIDQAVPALQARLTRLLEERSFVPQHGREAVPLDLRIVAASASSLDAAVREGRFAPALFYRLAGMTLTLPPLRDRQDDLALLFAHLLDRAAARHRRPPPAIGARTRRRLAEHRWPGNVRELAHFAERVVLGLEAEDADEAGADATLPERVARFEEAAIRDAFLAEDGDVGRTATRLGIPRETFYYKTKRYGIDLAALRRRAKG
ncbi:two-component system C4-dicarboxylate transport response regulator DctD [Sphingomonas zeicaulis]|uniref:sigma-54-dependent transcriptional regulator n=1 Tax=Sphingomonas zeicaulis TaxID=1632740 RepID=UPI003D1999E6